VWTNDKERSLPSDEAETNAENDCSNARRHHDDNDDRCCDNKPSRVKDGITPTSHGAGFTAFYEICIYTGGFDAVLNKFVGLLIVGPKCTMAASHAAPW